MRIGKLFCLSLAALSLTLPSNGQERPVADSEKSILRDARSLFESGDYGAAKDCLDEWGRTEASGRQGYLWREEADYMYAVITSEQDYAKGKEALQAFLERYPMSVWGNRVKALTGICCARRGEYDEALVWFEDCNPEKLSMDDSRRMTFYHALSLMKNGRIPEGYVLLSVLDNLEGYDDDVVFYKACADYSEGRLDAARVGFTKSLRVDKYGSAAQLFLAEIALREGKADDAATMAESLLDDDNDVVSSEAERILGQARFAQGKWSDADEMLTSYVLGDTKPDRLDVYQLGMANWQLGDHGRALEFLGMVSVEDDVLEQNAWYHMGLSSLEMGDKSDAILAFEQVASMTADKSLSEAGLYNYAMCVQESGYSPFAEPVTAFERFLNEYPDSKYADDVNERLAEVYLQSNSYDVALESIEKIHNPGRKILEARQQLLYRKGLELYAGGDFDKVANYMTQASDMSQYDRETAANACFWRAETYFRQGKFAQAASDYNRYFGLIPDSRLELYAPALYGAGYSAYKSSEWSKALSQWKSLTSSYASKVSREMLSDTYARMGDCYFYEHDYSNAEECYTNSLSIYRQNGDYALYRMGLVLGLKKDYNGKVSMMERLCNEYPSSDYCAQALFEEARACQQMDKSSDAIHAFERVVSGYPKSDLARKASAEIALIYYQNDNYEKAIPAYKYVIENYPGSDESAMAMRDLRSVYVETGRVDQYLAYSESVGGQAPVAAVERDSLTYASAELLFTRGKYGDAVTAFENYLHQFPEGAYAVNANYYLGLIYSDQKEYGKALQYLLAAAGKEHSRFCTDALDRASQLAYDTKDYSLALATYRRLYDRANTAELSRKASLGAVRSAYKVENYGMVIEFADKALSSRLEPGQTTEVNYMKGKSLLALDKTAEALPVLRDLSSDTRSAYGAESDWLVSSILYGTGDIEAAEKNIMDLISGGTPHTYWLARSFILLSDIYLAQGKTVEARQYLISLRQNYKENDDIASMIEERLAKLE